MQYERPNLGATDVRELNMYLFRLVEQIEEHETILRKDIEVKGIENGKSTTGSN